MGTAAPYAVAAPKTAPAPLACEGPLACADDSAMLELERRIEDNFRFGQLIEIDYRTPERVLGDVASGGAWGDSALWTGVYLAGQSMRYAVAQDKLKKLSRAHGNPHVDEAEKAAAVEYWTAQREQAAS